MAVIEAIYENGVLRPLADVELVEGERYRIEPELIPAAEQRKSTKKAIYEILSRRYDSGYTDTAERHNEHQP